MRLYLSISPLDACISWPCAACSPPPNAGQLLPRTPSSPADGDHPPRFHLPPLQLSLLLRLNLPIFWPRNLPMEAAAGTGLRCSLNPAPNPRKISARVRLTTKRQPCAATCRPLLLLRPTASAYSAAIDSGAGCSGVSKRLAVFVSGGGSNFRSVHEAALGGKVNGHVAVLVTDKPGCGGADYARCNGVPVVVFPKSKSAPEGVSTDQLLNVLRDLKVDFVLLAGYLKLIPGELVQAYPRSMLNIHPSLLPAFSGKGYYGSKVHKAVIASGARYSGPTVHFVDKQFDTGRTLAQRVVPVLANDTPEQLAARVLHEEHQVYVEAVAALCDDRIVWREDGVPLIRSQGNPNEYM